MNKVDKILAPIICLINDLDNDQLVKLSDIIEDKVKMIKYHDTASDIFESFVEEAEELKLKLSKNVIKFFKSLRCEKYDEEMADYMVNLEYLFSNNGPSGE